MSLVLRYFPLFPRDVLIQPLQVFVMASLILAGKASAISQDETLKFNPSLPDTVDEKAHPFSIPNNA